MNEKKEIISLVLGNGVIFPKIINEDEGVRIVFFNTGERHEIGETLRKETKLTPIPNNFNGFYFKNIESVDVVIDWFIYVKKVFLGKENKNEN